jgi:hypothetical protein
MKTSAKQKRVEQLPSLSRGREKRKPAVNNSLDFSNCADYVLQTPLKA